jgi:geranylgeranyl diphosphate synthase type I
MSIESYLVQKQQIIKPALENLISKLDQPTRAFEFDIKDFLTRFIGSGKLYRGSLVFLGYDLFAQTKSRELPKDDPVYPSLLKIALALELVHSAFLIHDDVMDQDKLRRSKKTFHLLMTELAQKKKFANSSHLGNSLAICLGDLLFFLAQKELEQIDLEDEIVKKIFKTYTEKMILTTWGQVDDVYLSSFFEEVDQQTILNVYRLKTAHYSLVNPLLMGAIVAQAQSSQLNLLTDFALNLGIIYQFQDDKLNLFGESEQIGKSTGSDIKENKKTIYRQLLLQLAQGSDKKTLSDLFNNSRDVVLSDQKVEEIRQFLAKYQIQKEVDSLTTQYTQKMNQALLKLEIDSQQKALLKDLIKLMTERVK